MTYKFYPIYSLDKILNVHKSIFITRQDFSIFFWCRGSMYYHCINGNLIPIILSTHCSISKEEWDVLTISSFCNKISYFKRKMNRQIRNQQIMQDMRYNKKNRRRKSWRAYHKSCALKHLVNEIILFVVSLSQN